MSVAAQYSNDRRERVGRNNGRRFASLEFEADWVRKKKNKQTKNTPEVHLVGKVARMPHVVSLRDIAHDDGMICQRKNIVIWSKKTNIEEESEWSL